jgi:hypothetical protein
MGGSGNLALGTGWQRAGFDRKAGCGKAPPHGSGHGKRFFWLKSLSHFIRVDRIHDLDWFNPA